LKYIIPIILTLCIIIAYIQYGYKPDKILRKKPQSPLVEIAKIEKGSFNSILKMRGDLISKSELTVRTRIPGIVEKIIVEMGDSINKNQILLKLDDTEAQLKLAQSKADMLIAEGIVDQAKINHEVFEEKYSLNQKLYEKKLISKSELQKSQQETKKAIVGLSISKAKKKQAEINLQRSIVNLENCTIHSPWNKSGWVSDVHVNEGALVNNNGSVITIKDLNTLLAVGYVTERDYSRLKVGQQAEIYVQSFPEEIFTGNIVNISPSFDSKSRQAKFQLKINNQAGKLRPGMMASISIDTGIRADLNLLLKEAVIYYRGQQGVFLYNEEKKNAIFKKVILGEIKDDFAEVKSPKNLKGFVVTIGNHMLRSGRPVRVNTPTLKQANKGSQKKNKKAEK
jgi:RND family efflux transporter MFP subunit